MYFLYITVAGIEKEKSCAKKEDMLKEDVISKKKGVYNRNNLKPDGGEEEYLRDNSRKKRMKRHKGHV